jgi:hypothetical protein
MVEITVTAGPKNAHTDPETGLRFYRWKGRDLPSSTSLRRMAGIPFFLHQWTLSKVVERAVTEYPIMQQMMERPAKPRERVRDKNVAKEVGRWLRSAATEERDAAAELGTAVHDAATSGFTLDSVDDDVRPFLAQYYNWLVDNKVEILAVEKQVFNLTVGYAGSFDLLVRFPDGEIFVVDIKTGKGTYPDHAIQVISYGCAEFVGEDDVIDVATTKLLHAATGMALLHLSEDGWTWQRIPSNPDLFAAFRGLAAFAVWSYEHQQMASIVTDVATGHAP